MNAPRHHVPPRITSHARANRRPLTPPEARLWAHLRDRQLAGLKFRRQQVLGSYIVDFCCFEARLVVELDGDSHVERAAYDTQRTMWLRGRGFTVVRFNNGDVYRNMERVLEAILLASRGEDAPSSPAPLPRWGEGSPRAPLRDQPTHD